MFRRRLVYFLLIIVVIISGLLSRHAVIVPLIVGDILWSVMVFLLVRFLLISIQIKWVFLISLGVCYLVEISQLYHEPWIDALRNTTLWALLLGRGFLWSDVLAYTIGVTFSAGLECMLFQTNRLRSCL
ncbi:MAG: DUF2809 domain-containing protein [Pedobacter sp.]